MQTKTIRLAERLLPTVLQTKLDPVLQKADEIFPETVKTRFRNAWQ